MAISTTRIVLAVLVSAVVAPIAGCTNDGPQNLASPGTLGPGVKASIECGEYVPGSKVELGEFGTEHFLVTTDEKGNSLVEHLVLPIKISYAKDSSPEFIEALAASDQKSGGIVLPSGTAGSATFTYPTTQEGEETTYVFAIAPDGTVSVRLGGTLKDPFVATHADRKDRSRQVSAGGVTGDVLNPTGGGVSGGVEASFLGPDSAVWADAPDAPGATGKHGFSPDGPNGVHLNRELSAGFPGTETNAGLAVADVFADQACLLLTGGLARELIGP